MSELHPGIASIAERARTWGADAPVVAAHFLGGTAAFVLGEENVLLADPDNEPREVRVHDGAILSSAADRRRLITGGDDGAVRATDAGGAVALFARDAGQRWIDHVAIAPDGTAAWSAGKSAWVKTGKDDVRTLDVASSVGGLAFAPKGLRLAIAHYNGATLWFPNAQTRPEILEWKGSHLAVTFSPDGKYVVTSMQEPALHGWRLADGKHMRMTGYAARVRSLCWSTGGGFLATSGSDQLILWPFQGKDGPMGKQPRVMAPYSARLVAVACHPKEPVVAAGYADGLVLLVRLGDAAEILARPAGGSPVTALAWRADGGALAFGCDDGVAGMLTL
jgi:WD40 repeat protein